MLCDEHPVRTKKTRSDEKNLQGKGGQQQQIIVSNFPQMFSLNS